MGADPPAIAGFGGAALSAGLSDMVAGSVVGAVSMDSCLISDMEGVKCVFSAPEILQGKSNRKIERRDERKPRPIQRFYQTNFGNGSRKTIQAETTSTYLTGVALRKVNS